MREARLSIHWFPIPNLREYAWYSPGALMLLLAVQTQPMHSAELRSVGLFDVLPFGQKPIVGRRRLFERLNAVLRATVAVWPSE